MSCVWHRQTAAAEHHLLYISNQQRLSFTFTTNFRLSATKQLSCVTAQLCLFQFDGPDTACLSLYPRYWLFTVLAVDIQTVAFFQYLLTRWSDRRLQGVCNRPGLSARHYDHQPPAASLLFPKTTWGRLSMLHQRSPVRMKRHPAVKLQHDTNRQPFKPEPAGF